MRWKSSDLTFCYCRSKDYVDHLNQELTPEQAEHKREYIAEKRREKEALNAVKGESA